MKNLNISKKLIIGFGIVLCLLIVSNVLSMISVSQINEQIDLYAEYTVPNSNSLWSMRRDLVSAQRYVLRALLSKDAQETTDNLSQAENDGQAVLNTLELYSKNQKSNSYDGQTNAVRTYLENAVVHRREIAGLLANKTDENLLKAKDIFYNDYIPAFDEAASLLISFSGTANAEENAQHQKADSILNLSWVLLISTAAISLLITFFVAAAIRKSILTPVKELENVYAQIEKGNLQSEIAYDSRDEIGNLARSIKKTNAMLASYIKDISDKLGKMSIGDMRIKIDMDYIGDFAPIRQAMQNMASALSHTLTTINMAAEQVSTGAAQVAGGAQALAAGSTEQASSVEELSASVTIIAKQAEENSSNVKMATQYVEQAGTNVRNGSEHMKLLTEAMANVGSASNQIANITKVIEDIAFQTNILALNAAIEAARAGNAGKGFAVVADEVRNLAAKSAEAAKQTAELIRHSVATVAEGTQLTDQTAQILKNVEDKAKLVEESIVRIDQASSEQAAAIEQIKQGLTQVNSVVQTNAATAEENSATSEEMSAQAAALQEEVEKFKLNSSNESESITSISLAKEPFSLNKHKAKSGFGKF